MNAQAQAKTQTTYSVAPMVSGGKFQLLLLAHCQTCGNNYHAALSHVCQPARPQQRRQVPGEAQSADRRNVTAYPRQDLRPSQHVGAVSQRIQIKARIRCCIRRETRYGDAWWTLLIDGNHYLDSTDHGKCLAPGPLNRRRKAPAWGSRRIPIKLPKKGAF